MNFLHCKNLYHYHRWSIDPWLNPGGNMNEYYRARDKSLDFLINFCVHRIKYKFNMPGGMGSLELDWCEQNCQGKFFLGLTAWINNKEIPVAVFELETDAVAFKLTWGGECL